MKHILASKLQRKFNLRPPPARQSVFRNADGLIIHLKHAAVEVRNPSSLSLLFKTLFGTCQEFVQRILILPVANDPGI